MSGQPEEVSGQPGEGQPEEIGFWPANVPNHSDTEVVVPVHGPCMGSPWTASPAKTAEGGKWPHPLRRVAPPADSTTRLWPANVLNFNHIMPMPNPLWLGNAEEARLRRFVWLGFPSKPKCLAHPAVPSAYAAEGASRPPKAKHFVCHTLLGAHQPAKAAEGASLPPNAKSLAWSAKTALASKKGIVEKGGSDDESEPKAKNAKAE